MSNYLEQLEEIEAQIAEKYNIAEDVHNEIIFRCMQLHPILDDPLIRQWADAYCKYADNK